MEDIDEKQILKKFEINIGEISKYIEEKSNELSAEENRNNNSLIINLGFGFFGHEPWYAFFSSIYWFFKRRIINNKKQKFNKELSDGVLMLNKFKAQNEFLEKLVKLIGSHYNEVFKNKKYTKEEEICKSIKLNTPKQMESKIIVELKKQAEMLLESQEGNHYNILVLGRTGVGKSTLINVVLNLEGDKAAKENPVKPETGVENVHLPNLEEKSNVECNKKKFVPLEYSSEKSSLVLLDSRGIEISNNYNIDVATEDIKQFIEERNGLNSDPDKFIHCIWYLVSGNRFEDDEGKYVKSLKSLYTNFGLPIIFVYTKAIFEKETNLIKGRIEDFVEEKINFIPIIARNMEIKIKKKVIPIEAYGVFEEDGLIKQSFDLAKKAIKSSYFNYMKNLLKNIIFSDVKLKANLNANSFIIDKIQSIIYNEKESLEIVRNNFQDVFLNIISSYLIDEEVPEFTLENKELISKFFNCFPDVNDPKLVHLIDILREKESDKSILNFIDINLKAGKYLGIQNNLDIQEIQKMLNKEIEEPIKDRIPYIVLSYILMKYMIFLGNFLFKILSEDFEQSYKRLEDIISGEMKTIINKVYDNIMKKIDIKIE